jgi:hypothetical protein
MSYEPQMPPPPQTEQPPGGGSRILGWVDRHKIWLSVIAVAEHQLRQLPDGQRVRGRRVLPSSPRVPMSNQPAANPSKNAWTLPLLIVATSRLLRADEPIT